MEIKRGRPRCLTSHKEQCSCEASCCGQGSRVNKRPGMRGHLLVIPGRGPMKAERQYASNNSLDAATSTEASASQIEVKPGWLPTCEFALSAVQERAGCRQAQRNTWRRTPGKSAASRRRHGSKAHLGVYKSRLWIMLGNSVYQDWSALMPQHGCDIPA